MSWFGKFAFGAFSGVVLSAAIAVPVVHYAENGGMDAIHADFSYVTASIKDSLTYKPENAEESAQTRAIRTEVENSRSQILPSKEDIAFIGNTIGQAMNEAQNATELATSPNPFVTLFQHGFAKRCGRDVFNQLSASEKIRRRRACEQAEKYVGNNMAWAQNPETMSAEDSELMTAIRTKNFAKVREICRRPMTRGVNAQESLRDQVCEAMLRPN